MISAAAPSPNSPLLMMFATDTSSRWSVSEHSSTASSMARRPGHARSTSLTRAVPAAPATQPSPKIGVRVTSGRKPRRFTNRASIEGVANPVTVTKQR